jgi:hypothetical protein
MIFMITAHSLKSPENVVLINLKRPALNSINRLILLPIVTIPTYQVIAASGKEVVLGLVI